MGSVLFVLAVLITVINLANYVSRDRASTEVLTLLSESDGVFPELGPDNLPLMPRGGFSEDRPEPPANDRLFLQNRHSPFSEESPYETRYFTVELTKDNVLVDVDTGQIAAVNKSEAVKLAKELSAAGKQKGYTGNYKYLATEQADGNMLYVFLDCTRDLSSIRQFFEISVLVSVIGAAAIFVLVVLLSRRAIRPIEESYRKQKEFITNASHELKTPLAVIRSCTDVLAMEEDEGNKKWIDGISSEVTKLSALVNDLVGLSRMDEGTDRLQKEDFDLSTTVSETLEPFALSAESREIGFSKTIEEGVHYRGDEKLLRQLVSILADNAVKYTPAGGKIQFSLKRSGRHCKLVAENTAEGLPAGRQERLFDRFYRGDESHSSKKQGFGIGLSMARAIVGAHGGKIEAVAEDGRLKISVRL